jgi:L-threonylcarbamoyladenylate synthase
MELPDSMPGAPAQPGPDGIFLVDPGNPDPRVVAEAGRILRGGGIVAHPSDTVFGLAVAGRHPGALARLQALKGRGEDRPLICLIDEPGRVDHLIHSVRRYAIDYISKIWPGPLTLLFNARPEAPCRAADGSVALRCPAHPLTRALIREVAGVMASTSANRSGEPPVASGREALALFGTAENGLRMVIDEATPAAARAGIVSTLVDCRGPVPVLLRAGAVSAAALGLRAD